MTTTSPIGFPPKTNYDITGITQSMPAVVSVNTVAEDDAFILQDGMTITLTGIHGMIQLNKQRFVITFLDTVAKTFALYTIKNEPVDTTDLPAYTFGGQANIISYLAQDNNPPGLMYNTQPITV